MKITHDEQDYIASFVKRAGGDSWQFDGDGHLLVKVTHDPIDFILSMIRQLEYRWGSGRHSDFTDGVWSEYSGKTVTIHFPSIVLDERGY